MFNRFKSLTLAALGLFANPTHNFGNPQSSGSWLANFVDAFDPCAAYTPCAKLQRSAEVVQALRSAAHAKRERKALKRLDNQRRAKSHQPIDVTSRAMRLKECPVNV